MKKIIALTALTLVAGIFVSCDKKNDNDHIKNNIIVKPRENVEPDTIIHKMNEIDVTVDTVKWVGSTYKVRVHRYTNDSISAITDEGGKQYRNNLIKVIVTRKDGSTFFEKVFSKAMFESFLDEEYLKHNVLLGMVYNGRDENNLRFLGSVGRPDILTEEFVPFNVYVSRMGEVKVEKANLENLDGYKVFEEVQIEDEV